MSSSGLTMLVTLKLEIAGGKTETGASRLNSVVKAGTDSAFGWLEDESTVQANANRLYARHHRSNEQASDHTGRASKFY